MTWMLLEILAPLFQGGIGALLGIKQYLYRQCLVFILAVSGFN
jgi:hypothetical protein